MFELNTYLIIKMGWTPYSMSRGIGLPNIFEGDDLVRYFIFNKSSSICYLIKEQKQKKKKSYKFIIMDYKNLEDPKFEIKDFDKNEELFKFVIDYGACNEEYRRHFKINKIIK